MRGHVPATKKPPDLLREDSRYVLEQLSSIIIADDYEDLSNHETEAIGETGLFSIAQLIESVFLPFLPLCLVIYSNPLLFLDNANDERVNGPLPIPRDGTGPRQGKGTANRGGAGGVEGLEDGLGKEACLVEASPR